MCEDLEENYWIHQLELYDSLDYDKKTKYLEWQPARWSANRAAVNNILNKIDDIKTVCEVGAGSAAFSLEMYRQNSNLNLTAIDRSRIACEYGTKISKDMEIPIKYINDDIFKLNNDIKYDFVLSLGVIEHYTTDEQLSFINKCKEISNKYILFAIPNQESIIFKSYINWCNRNNNNYEEEHEELDTDKLVNLLEKCNLKPIIVDGFQLFLSESDFLESACDNNSQYVSVLKKALMKENQEIGGKYPKYNFKIDDIPVMAKVEEGFSVEERLNLSFMTYVLCEKIEDNVDK